MANAITGKLPDGTTIDAADVQDLSAKLKALGGDYVIAVAYVGSVQAIPKSKLVKVTDK